MPAPDTSPAIGFCFLVCEPVGEPGAAPVVPPLGAAAWRAVAVATGAPILGVSAETPSEGDDTAAPAALAWLRPCGTVLAAAAAAGALIDGTITAVSPCGSRVLVRAAVRCRADVAPRPGTAGAAAASLFAHLRCDWHAADAPGLEMQPAACGVAGCALGCGGAAVRAPVADGMRASDAEDDPAAAPGSLAALLADLRPPRVDASAPLVPKNDESLPNPGDLPAAALDALLCALDPASLRALASTCRGLRARAASVAPGLHLQLHAHQRDALAWMRAREARRAPLCAPLWRRLSCTDGATTVWAHELTGQLTTRPPPRCADARGGLLCDEPGLGKTVTVIALLLATRGVRAAPPRGCALQRDASGAPFYADPGGVEEAEEAEEAVEEAVQTQQPAANLEAPSTSSPADVALLLSPSPRTGDAGPFSPLTSPPGGSGRARRASAETLTRLGHFAALLSAKESGGGGSGTCDDVAAAQRVYLSGATLVCCPSVLLAHWLAQLAPAAASGRLRVAVADAATKDSGGLGADRADWVPNLEQLPLAELASRWDVVLLPLHRLSHAHGAGGGALLRVRWLRVVLDEGHALGASLGLTSRLAVARALRAERRWVVTGTPTPAALRAGQLAHLRPLLAFIREGVWGLAPEKAWAAAVQRPLEAGAEAAVDPAAAASGEAARRAAAARLAGVLRRVAARTRKADIALRPAVRVEALLRFNAAHAAHYNDLAAHVRRALLLADWGDPSHEQSLLHARNAALGRAAADNLREAACVAGRAAYLLAPGEAERSLAALTEALRARGRAGEGLEARVARCEAALRAGRGECDACARSAPVPLITPCGHVLCCDCVGEGAATAHHARTDHGALAATGPDAGAAGRREGFEAAPTGCACCGEPYRMQPPHPRADNPAPRQAVPQDLIELQPGYEHSGWAVDWDAESQGHSSKVAYLLRRLREVGAAPLPPHEVPPAAAAAALAAGAWPWPQPDAAAIAARASRAQRAAAAAAAASAPSSAVPPPPPPPPEARAPPVFPTVSGSSSIPKAIVYSSFQTHLHVLDLALTGAGVPFSTLRRLGFTRRDKEAALAAFRHDPLTRVLLLDRAGAEGLDLSFASHVFLCEPLADASLEAQVISRAHRMGQTGCVHAEILAMHGTAEATLLQARRGGSQGGQAAEALSRRAILTALRLAPMPSGAQGGDAAIADDDDVLISARRAAVEAPPAKRPRFAPPDYARAPAEEPPADADADADADAQPVDGAYVAAGGDDLDPDDEAAMDAAAGGEAEPPSAQDDQAGGGDDDDGDDDDDDDDAPFDAASAWTLRLRGPQLPASGAALSLPRGGATTLRELRRRAARAAGLEASSLRMRAGFPPRPLDGDGASGATSAAQAGLSDRDVLSLDGVAAAAPATTPGAHAAAAPMPPSSLAPPAAAAGTTPARKRAAKGGSRRFPGKARRVGLTGAPPPGGGAAAGPTSAAALPTSAAALEAEALAEAGPSAAAALAAGFEADSSWLMGGGGGPESGLGAALLGAAHGGGGGRDAVAASLRRAMSAAVSQRAADAEGAARCAAAAAGAVRFESLADGRLAVTFSAPSARGASAVSRQDCVPDLPRLILPFVLRLVLGDGDASCRANLQPQNMAVASPRMFWAVVRFGGVGPTRSFAQALATLVPGVDWEAVTRRERLRPERYRPENN